MTTPNTQPGAAPATGNTEKEQEMYAAGIRTGEANAKNNAAIRNGVPAGWKLVPIEPTETMVVCGFESRPDPVFSKPEEWEAFDAMTGCQQAAHKARLCYAAMLNAAPAAPGVSTVTHTYGAPAEVAARIEHYLIHNGQENSASLLLYEAMKALRAPAASDALAGSAPEWVTCESRGPWARNSLKAAIDLLREKETRARHAFTKDYMGLPARYIADAYGEAAAVVERKLGAIAAQRKGDA